MPKNSWSSTETKNYKSRASAQTKVIEKNIKEEASYDIPESPITVITKTRTPKTIIQSEHINNELDIKFNPNNIIKYICLFIMCVIILITFFLSLKTYNILNNLVIG